MANFDHQSLERLKKLCKLDCSQEESEEILSSLSQVLEYIEQLKEVDIEGVKPCRFVLGEMVNQGLRDDEVGETLSREGFLLNAPDQVGGMIRVPSVLKQTP